MYTKEKRLIWFGPIIEYLPIMERKKNGGTSHMDNMVTLLRVSADIWKVLEFSFWSYKNKNLC